MRSGSTSFASATLFIYFPSMLMSMGQGMIIPALPTIGLTFGVSGAIAVQAVTSQLIGRTVSMIPAGALVDRYGTRPLMISGASLATVSTLIAAFSPSFVIILIKCIV